MVMNLKKYLETRKYISTECKIFVDKHYLIWDSTHTPRRYGLSVNFKEIQMILNKTPSMGLFVGMLLATGMFMSAAQANATDIPHILSGSTTTNNPGVTKTEPHRVDITTTFNVRYNSLGACNTAKESAENPSFVINPASYSARYGTLVTISTLKCTVFK